MPDVTDDLLDYDDTRVQRGGSCYVTEPEEVRLAIRIWELAIFPEEDYGIRLLAKKRTESNAHSKK